MKNTNLSPDIYYLLDPKITDVIGQGLATLYAEKPSDPVDFLAKWLLKQSQVESQKTKVFFLFFLIKKLAEVEKSVQEMRQRQKQILASSIEKQKAEEAQKSAKNKELEDFRNLIKAATDMPRYFEQFCNFLHGKIKATGIYMAKLERKKKPINDESNDKAHIDETEPLQIRYIATNSDHKFLLDKVCKTEESFTYNWLTEKAAPAPNSENPESQEKGKEENKENQAQPKEAKIEEEKLVNFKYLKDVLKEPKLRFFRVPKLGSYLAISLTHKSCLLEESLDKAYESSLDVQKRKSEQQAQKQQKEEELAKEKEEKLANGEPYEAPPPIEWPVIEEPPYLTQDQNYFICMDTLGQDREFTEDERKFAIEMVEYMGNCWREAEKKRLTADKELRIELKKRMEEFKEKGMQEMHDEIEKIIEDFNNDEKNAELHEDEKEIKTSFIKLQTLAKYIASGEFRKHIMQLTKFNILKYPRILQYAFYMLGYNREEICEPNTNKMDWEKSRLKLNDDFFNKITNYSPFGQKPAEIPKYRTLNMVEKMLEEIKEDEVTIYNTGLAQLMKWMREIIKMRKADILRRRSNRQKLIEERENKIKEKEEYLKRREEELQARIKEAEEEHKAELDKIKAEEEQKGEFEQDEVKAAPPEFKINEKELMAEWDEKNPQILVPAEIPEELDNDCTVEAPPPNP